VILRSSAVTLLTCSDSLKI